MLLTPAERRWAWGCALAVMLAASLPYLLLLAANPPGYVFWGFVNNPDDQCVYLSWMRQAASGHFFLQNLYTGDAQLGRTINLFFWVLGSLAGLAHLSLALVYHLARFFFGALLLVVVYHLAAFLTEDRLTRRAAFGFVALSSGLGWLFWSGSQDNPLGSPIDTWQPEAITFLSLYANALFCAAMAAMAGLFLCLLLAQQTGKRPYVIGAGLLGFLLGNFHSYDIITVAVVWGAYLVVIGLTARRLPMVELRQAGIAALIALPSVAYQYYLLRADPVFQARAAVQTPSTAPWNYLLGYGLLVPLAIFGAWRLAGAAARRPAAIFLPVWAVVGLAVAYLPLSFQRKLAEGLHIPIAVLAALGAVALVRRFVRQPRLIGVGIGLLLLLTVPTNFLFLCRDFQRATDLNLGSSLQHWVFWPQPEMTAFQRLAEWTPPSALLQAMPSTSCLIPAMSGRHVWAGHWGETPDFDAKRRNVVAFFRPEAASNWRRGFLAETGVTAVFVGPDPDPLARLNDLEQLKRVEDSLGREPFLRVTHRLGDTLLYEVTPDWRRAASPGRNAPGGR